MSHSITNFKKELQASGLRLTQSRIAVYSILNKNREVFLSPHDIYEKIAASKKYKCDRVSVYRVLSTLEKIGLVKISHFQGEASRYKIHFHTEECKRNCELEHEHYFKCIQCDTIEPIGECFIEKKVKELEKKGFKSINHHFEISGYCPSCQ